MTKIYIAFGVAISIALSALLISLTTWPLPV